MSLNDGAYDLMDVRIPLGTILNPVRPAALSCRTHLLGRTLDLMIGTLGQRQPKFMTAAGYGDSKSSRSTVMQVTNMIHMVLGPHFFYSGYRDDGTYYQVKALSFSHPYSSLITFISSAVPDRVWRSARTTGWRWHGRNFNVSKHAISPQRGQWSYPPLTVVSLINGNSFLNSTTHYESSTIRAYPIQVVSDNIAVEMVYGSVRHILYFVFYVADCDVHAGFADYRFLAHGEVSLHDDRWLTKPWGVNGGEPGQRSRKTLLQYSIDEKNPPRIPLPSKADYIQVAPGDVLEWRTWGYVVLSSLLMYHRH